MLNHAELQGRITKNIEVKVTNSGKSVASFSIAHDRNYNDKTDFFNCVAWEKTAEFMAKYFRQGSLVVLEGRFETRQYEDKNKNKREAVEFIVERAHFCGSKQDSKPAVEADEANPKEIEVPNEDDGQIEFNRYGEEALPDEDDLPF